MKFMAMCSSGLGSSFMVEMNIRKVLDGLGLHDVEASHADLGSTSPGDADVFFIGKDLENSVSGFDNVVVLDSIIDEVELEEKVTQAAKDLGLLS